MCSTQENERRGCAPFRVCFLAFLPTREGRGASRFLGMPHSADVLLAVGHGAFPFPRKRHLSGSKKMRSLSVPESMNTTETATLALGVRADPGRHDCAATSRAWHGVVGRCVLALSSAESHTAAQASPVGINQSSERP